MFTMQQAVAVSRISDSRKLLTEKHITDTPWQTTARSTCRQLVNIQHHHLLITYNLQTDEGNYADD